MAWLILKSGDQVDDQIPLHLSDTLRALQGPCFQRLQALLRPGLVHVLARADPDWVGDFARLKNKFGSAFLVRFERFRQSRQG